MKTVTKKQLTIALLFLFLLVVALFTYKERRTSHCLGCRSQQHVGQWRLGWWKTASLPLAPEVDNIETSHLYRDLFTTEHQHEWSFSQGSPYYVLGLRLWSGCAIGSGRHQHPFCSVYELSPDFRKFIQAEISSGRVDQKSLQQIIRLPEWQDHENPTSDEQEKLEDLADALLSQGGW